ncbi:MAG: B12-binding domain-containing radical SAM protein [Treponema sp.]|nr:B12-binding domain-containing radical SAM protein [Treponema sp.]
MKDIILTTINAKWIHPSLALRLLKANLGSLEDRCEIIEFALRQPLQEKLDSLLTTLPPDGHTRILGISVSIWNHTATIELLKELNKLWSKKPIIVLGGPEVSYLPPDAEIFHYADYVIQGEGEVTFRLLCEELLLIVNDVSCAEKIIPDEPTNLNNLKTAYHLYTDEDLGKKLIYVESSRGCPFKCDFCLSAIDNKVREFPLDQFLKEMDSLITRGVRTFKFLDRSININIKRSLQIIEFFLDKINNTSKASAPSASSEPEVRRLCENSSPCKSADSNTISNEHPPFVVHFEMVPSLFPPELCEALARFPSGTLRLEIGIQTLNPEVSARINRPSNPEKELEALKFLREKTNAIIHADLIAGLPGENLESFGNGFDRLWSALYADGKCGDKAAACEIQLGILKLLPGAPIARFNEEFGMSYNSQPPYEIEKTSSISVNELKRVKNFARFWEIIVNRGLLNIPYKGPVFKKFMAFSDELLEFFGKNWGINKSDLINKIANACL